MNINELMNKYNKCMLQYCGNECKKEKCEFNMPDDVWDACGIITEYLEELK